MVIKTPIMTYCGHKNEIYVVPDRSFRAVVVDQKHIGFGFESIHISSTILVLETFDKYTFLADDLVTACFESKHGL